MTHNKENATDRIVHHIIIAIIKLVTIIKIIIYYFFMLILFFEILFKIINGFTSTFYHCLYNKSCYC